MAGADTGVRYYQGLHDVASVLLLVTGSDVAAFRLLRHLTSCQLRDCTRATLDAALETLHLLPAVLAAADVDVARRVAASGAPPHFALPWLLTWFARSAPDLAAAARLFDLFAASPPVAPVYVAAAALAAHRAIILAAPPDTDAAEMHALLSRLDVLGGASSPGARVDGLAAAAVALLRRVPPGPLLACARARGAARAATAALAKLQEDGSWAVADTVGDAEWRAAAGRGKPRASTLAAGAATLLAVMATAALARNGAVQGF